MKQKQLEKVKARTLRQQGWAIPVIAKELNVNQGTISLWCRDILLTQEQLDFLIGKSRENKKNLIAAEINKKNRIAIQNKRQEEGRRDIGELSERELFLIGSALYLGEGTKTTRQIAFANSDPQVIKLFIKWLTICLKVSFEKIRILLHLHEDLVEQEERDFWKTEIGFTEEQFYKTQIKKNPITGFKKKKDYHGTAQIPYSDW